MLGSLYRQQLDAILIGISQFVVLISPAVFTKGLALMKTIPIEGGLFSVGSLTYAACRLNSLATLSLEHT